jgi:hypothetical protein
VDLSSACILDAFRQIAREARTASKLGALAAFVARLGCHDPRPTSKKTIDNLGCDAEGYAT